MNTCRCEGTQDGPISPPAPGISCSECLNVMRDDVYRYKGRILCGDCRYEARTGKVARHPQCKCGTTSIREEKLGGVVNALMRFDVASQRQVSLINDWLLDSTLSLD